MKRRGGLTHFMGGCFECHGTDAHWHSRNVQALAAQHAKKYGHKTWCELGHSYYYEGEIGDDKSV